MSVPIVCGHCICLSHWGVFKAEDLKKKSMSKCESYTLRAAEFSLHKSQTVKNLLFVDFNLIRPACSSETMSATLTSGLTKHLFVQQQQQSIFLLVIVLLVWSGRNTVSTVFLQSQPPAETWTPGVSCSDPAGFHVPQKHTYTNTQREPAAEQYYRYTSVKCNMK